MKKTPQELLGPDEVQALRAWALHFAGNVAKGLEAPEDGGLRDFAKPPKAYEPLRRPTDPDFDLQSEVREAWRRLRETDEINRWLAIGAIIDTLLSEEQEHRTASRASHRPQKNAKVPGYMRRGLAEWIETVQLAKGGNREQAAAVVLASPLLDLEVTPEALVKMLSRESLFGKDKRS